MGYQSGHTTSISQDILIGFESGKLATGTPTNTIAIGSSAASNTAFGATGFNHTIIGTNALRDATMTGNESVFHGFESGRSCVCAGRICALGCRSLGRTAPFFCTVGTEVTVVGHRAGEAAAANKTVNNQAVLLGSRCSRTGNTVAANEVVMGYDTRPANVAGRLSIGQTMEALAVAATAGAVAKPGLVAGFIVIKYNNAVNKIPIYFP